MFLLHTARVNRQLLRRNIMFEPIFLENEVSSALITGALQGISGAIMCEVFPKVFIVNPLISALFLATMRASSEMLISFFNYYLDKSGYDKEKDSWTYYFATLGAFSLGMSLAFEVSALTIGELELFCLCVLSTIITDICLKVLQISFQPLRSNSNT